MYYLNKKILKLKVQNTHGIPGIRIKIIQFPSFRTFQNPSTRYGYQIREKASVSAEQSVVRPVGSSTSLDLATPYTG